MIFSNSLTQMQTPTMQYSFPKVQPNHLHLILPPNSLSQLTFPHLFICSSVNLLIIYDAVVRNTKNYPKWISTPLTVNKKCVTVVCFPIPCLFRKNLGFFFNLFAYKTCLRNRFLILCFLSFDTLKCDINLSSTCLTMLDSH